MALKRSNVEFAKRVFLDRLTADDAPSGHGPGVDYLYSGVYDPFNFGIGADCSGSAGIFIGAAFKGTDLSWSRQFSTETWRLADPHHGPFGGRRVGPRDWGDAPIRVCLTHGGGGPNSHMAVWIDGWMMESNGTYGTCTEGGGARSPDSPKWNDWWVIDGPIVEDTTFRQEQGYPRGLNYADGRPSGTVLKDAGVTFVVRHLSDGGTAQPQKRLTPEESNDLGANGIPIVSLWESYSNRMPEGYQAGLADARAAQDWHLHCSGPDDAPIYFSCSYDEPESDQPGVNDYLRACCDVLGGPGRVGIYGAYYVCKRALDAGVARFMWQTESWSGGNIDARVNIMQRNKMGFEQVGSVQAAINEAHTDYFGQWAVSGSLPNPIPAVTGATTPAAPQVPVTPVTPVTPSAPEASPMTDTIYADVSEWQQPVDDSYPHRVICIRSNDGTHRDEKWATNYEWCKRRCDDGALDFFIVYFVWRPNWEQAVATHKDLVGEPHPRMVVMIDVETWGGQIRGDQSAGLTGAHSAPRGLARSPAAGDRLRKSGGSRRTVAPEARRAATGDGRVRHQPVLSGQDRPPVHQRPRLRRRPAGRRRPVRRLRHELRRRAAPACIRLGLRHHHRGGTRDSRTRDSRTRDSRAHGYRADDGTDARCKRFHRTRPPAADRGLRHAGQDHRWPAARSPIPEWQRTEGRSHQGHQAQSRQGPPSAVRRRPPKPHPPRPPSAVRPRWRRALPSKRP